ncbi:MAG: helix-turn-helix transcriptional regulator [Clostridia bacterium]|nr:helix-turn-helix transcriptional regulator [Clostridia bacterium]
MFNSKLLQERRKEKGYTLLTLSQAMKNECNCVVDPRTISSWENNTSSNPRKKTLMAVSKILDLEVGELYVDDNIVDSEDIRFLSIIEKIISIHKRDKADIRLKQIREILK